MKINSMKVNSMKVLDLVLKGKWYDMIASGEKQYEYREKNMYWYKRLFFYKTLLRYYENFRDVPISDLRTYYRGFTHVRLHRGYTKITMTFVIEKITFGMGNPKWGAPTDRMVFKIKLGERLKNEQNKM